MHISRIDNRLKQECCPLCKSADISRIGELGYSEKINFSTHEIELIHKPELWKCKQCLSRFVQNVVDAETARMLYSTGQASERWSTMAFDQAKTPEMIVGMSKIFRDKGRVLDVGCNTGELLDFALGFGCETSGVEFSSVSRAILNHKGHKTYISLEESPERYDVITAFDLVEHLYDVPAFLKTCREKLTEQGKLVIVTGNVGSLSAKLSGARWWYAQYPEHIVFPSKKYFQEYSGFRVERWIPTYAAKGYKCSIVTMGKWAILWAIRQFHGGYTGLPSIGPDHALIVLGK